MYNLPFVQPDEKDENNILGLFPVFINMIISNVCNKCKGYSVPEIAFNKTENGYPSKKLRIRDVKNHIVGAHLTFALFGKFVIENFQGVYPYVGLVNTQGSALIVYNQKVKVLGLLEILKSCLLYTSPSPRDS